MTKKDSQEKKGGSLYCSFCGKSQHEVSKLIAGPSVFVCDECTQQCLDIIIDGSDESYAESFLSGLSVDWRKYVPLEDVQSIVREIEFPPEYRHAGITILSNFSTLIRDKYRDDNVRVAIKQEGEKVTLIIETEDGVRERVEQTLVTYGLVLSGVEPLESLSSDPYRIAELKSQLNIAKLQLENQKEMLALEKRHNEQLVMRHQNTEDQYRELVGIMNDSISGRDKEISFLRTLTKAHTDSQSSLAKDAIASLISIIQQRESDRRELDVQGMLDNIRSSDPEAFVRIRDFASSCTAGVVGNSLFAWLMAVINTFPR